MIRMDTTRGVAAMMKLERRVKIWELRKVGKSYREIGAQLGLSPQQVGNELHSCFRFYNKLTEEETNDARRLELERLDALQAAWWDRAIGTKYTPAEERAVRVIEMVMTRRAKLLGIDAPTQARVDISVTLDQILLDAPATRAAVEANAAEREAFLATRGMPVPMIEGDERVLDADYEEIEEPGVSSEIEAEEEVDFEPADDPSR